MRLLLFAACCAALLYGLLRPESPPHLFQHSDKALHLLGFVALSLSTRLAFPRISGWLLWGGLLLLAPLLEWLQHWLQSSRHFSAQDIAANLLGVSLAWLLCQLLQSLRSYLTSRT